MNYFQREGAAQQRVLGYTTVAEVSREEKLAFYQKVYGLFMFGFLVVGIFGYIGLQLVKRGILSQQMVFGLILVEAGIAWFAGTQLNNKKATLGLMMLYSAISGLTFGPLLAVAMIIATQNGMAPYALIGQAFGLTSLAFGGLTAYVFITKQDFSYLGGFLSMIFMAVFGFIILTWLGVIQMSTTMDLVFSSAMILILGLDVLYVTSKIQHHYGPQHSVFAAFELLISFVIMLWYVLRLIIILYSDR